MLEAKEETEAFRDQVRELLAESRELIADKERWCTGVMEVLEPPYPGTMKRCALGAIARRAKSYDGRVETEAVTTLINAALHHYGREVQVVNDKLGHEAVLDVYDKAIAAWSDDG